MAKKKIARIGDATIGTCYHPTHTPPLETSGEVTTGAEKTLCESSFVARLGDEVTASCGHKGIICGASKTVITEGKGTARLGDPFDNSNGNYYIGTITGGASKSFAGD